MKTTHLTTTYILGIVFIIFSSTTIAQVGINTTSPTETLHVNGNLRLDGAFMPGNVAGTTDKILLSQGAGTAPNWGPGFLNTAQIADIGKYFVPPFNINNSIYLQLDITDPNVTTASTISFTFIGNLPAGAGLLWGYNFTVITEARAGVIRFHITNVSGYNFTGLQMSYTAFY